MFCSSFYYSILNFLITSAAVNFCVPLPDGAAISIDGKLILCTIVPDSTFILQPAVVPVKFEFIDVVHRGPGHLGQGDLLGLVGGNGGGSSAGGVYPSAS